jgi:hypothetical protein
MGPLPNRHAALFPRDYGQQAAIMPFSKYDLDPEHIEAMQAAFHRVCDVLQLDCGRENPMTEIVATKIVELSKAGELNPERLCLDTLAELELAMSAISL